VFGDGSDYAWALEDESDKPDEELGKPEVKYADVSALEVW
jgi:hypothetical protein